MSLCAVERQDREGEYIGLGVQAALYKEELGVQDEEGCAMQVGVGRERPGHVGPGIIRKSAVG